MFSDFSSVQGSVQTDLLGGSSLFILSAFLMPSCSSLLRSSGQISRTTRGHVCSKMTAQTEPQRKAATSHLSYVLHNEFL